MLFLIYFNLIFTEFYQKIIKSSPTNCILEIKSTFEGPQLLKINASKFVTPYISPGLRYYNGFFYQKFENRFEVKICFKKHLLRVYEYTGNIEKGYIFPSMILEVNSRIYKSDEMLDLIVLPDFTVPFVAFNTCGSIFSIICNVILKKLGVF